MATKTEVLAYLKALQAREEAGGYQRAPVTIAKAIRAVERWGN